MTDLESDREINEQIVSFDLFSSTALLFTEARLICLIVNV